MFIIILSPKDNIFVLIANTSKILNSPLIEFSFHSTSLIYLDRVKKYHVSVPALLESKCQTFQTFIGFSYLLKMYSYYVLQFKTVVPVSHLQKNIIEKDSLFEFID